MAHQVTCITKDDRYSPHERIQGIGGVTDSKRWYVTTDRAIQGIESGEWQFYTVAKGRSVWVVVASHNGRKYLKTEADDFYPNNLLALPDCP